jgi:hypothetical protein
MNKHRRNDERGVALFIAVFTVLLVTAIGAAMIILTNTDTTVTQNFRDEQTAFFAAKAGMEEARDRFRTTASNSLTSPANLLPVTLPGNAGAFLYILNPASLTDIDTPWITNGNNYPDDEICAEMANMGNPCTGNPPVPAGGGWYTTTTASTAYQMTPKANWKWTRINLKTNTTSSGSTNLSTVDGNAANTTGRVCWTGTNEISTAAASCGAVNPNYLPVYVMTTLAVTPSGSRRMVQAEATATTFPNIPGPLVFDGSTPVFGPPHSNALNVDGTDHSSNANANGPQGYACPAPLNEPAIGTTSAADANSIGSSLPKPNDFTSGTNTGAAAVSDVSTQLTSLNTVSDLQNLVSNVTLIAGNHNQVYPGNPVGGIPNPGTISPYNPQVNVVQGDLTIGGGWSGAGILLVTGNLTMSGNPNFDGLILVIGTGQFIKNGGGNGTLDGSILVANLHVNADGTGALLPSGGPPGVPHLDWNGGGNAQFNYDSCWSRALSQGFAWRIVAVRELIR